MSTRGALDFLFEGPGGKGRFGLGRSVHFMELRGSTSRDLLGTQLAQLGLEVHELLL